MLFSKACEYGIRAMLYLALQNADHPIQVKQIARDLRIPLPFLSKIVHTLARNGLIESHKGPGGGVALAHRPTDVTLLQVVEVIDGLGLFTACALGLPNCTDDFPCPLHEQWGKLRAGIHTMLAGRTLSEVTDQLKKRGWILMRD